MTIQSLGRLALKQRGERGIRDVASEIGVSAATLSRVERGHLPDLDTFGKICRWLRVDPGSILGVAPARPITSNLSVHFRKDQALSPETAKALAQMILAAQRAMMMSEKDSD